MVECARCLKRFAKKFIDLIVDAYKNGRWISPNTIDHQAKLIHELYDPSEGFSKSMKQNLYIWIIHVGNVGDAANDDNACIKDKEEKLVLANKLYSHKKKTRNLHATNTEFNKRLFSEMNEINIEM